MGRPHPSIRKHRLLKVDEHQRPRILAIRRSSPSPPNSISHEEDNEGFYIYIFAYPTYIYIYLFFMDFYTFLEDKEDQLHMKLTQSSSSYEDSTKLGDDSSGSELISEAATSTIVVPINSKVG